MKPGATTVKTAPDAMWRRWELPTWAVFLCIYAGWGLATWYYHELPWWLVLPLGGWFVCWHGSLQHEVLHGHPTRRRWINEALVFPSLWLWLPYTHYRETHLVHHRNEWLTCPINDPESNYVTPAHWQSLGPARRVFYRALRTLAGRLLLLPAVAMWRVWRDDARLILAGDRDRARHWLLHIPSVALVLIWVLGVCDIPLWAYVLYFVYPGTSLTVLRSYAEHRPAKAVGERTAIVEAGPLMSLLFLNNNLHALHHEVPGVPWFELPGLYSRTRDRVLHDNGGLLYRGYGELFRRFLFVRRDGPLHPIFPVMTDAAAT